MESALSSSSYQPDYSAPSGVLNNASLHPNPEISSSSNRALSQPSANEHSEHGNYFYNARNQSWKYQDAGADDLRKNVDPPILDDEIQGLDDESMLNLGNESVDLPDHHVHEQRILQQPQHQYQHQFTSETMDLDFPSYEESSDTREYTDDDIDHDFLPTSETLAPDEDDHPFHSPCHEEDDEPEKPNDDTWDDNK